MNQPESKPLNATSAWRVLSNEQNKLLLKLKESEKFTFFVTDLTKIWSCSLCKTSFMKLLFDSNKLLFGFDSKQLLDMALYVLKNDDLLTKRSQVVIDSLQNTLMFRIRSQKDDCPVTIRLELQLGNAEMFYNNVTIPLLESIQDLKMSHDNLIAIISKKDREIDDYKQEGAKLGLKYLKTPIFDISGHNDKHSTLLKSFESLDVIESVLSNYKHKEISASKDELKNGDDVKSQNQDIKPEPGDLKSEVNTNTCLPVKEEVNFQPTTQPRKKTKKRGLQF